jgi:hypothetical protein
MRISERSLVLEQSESRSSDRPSRRRPYQPPQVARVKLEAEEVLALGCKMPAFTAAPGSVINCIVRGCAAAGS